MPHTRPGSMADQEPSAPGPADECAAGAEAGVLSPAALPPAQPPERAWRCVRWLPAARAPGSCSSLCTFRCLRSARTLRARAGRERRGRTQHALGVALAAGMHAATALEHATSGSGAICLAGHAVHVSRECSPASFAERRAPPPAPLTQPSVVRVDDGAHRLDSHHRALHARPDQHGSAAAVNHCTAAVHLHGTPRARPRRAAPGWAPTIIATEGPDSRCTSSPTTYGRAEYCGGSASQTRRDTSRTGASWANARGEARLEQPVWWRAGARPDARWRLLTRAMAEKAFIMSRCEARPTTTPRPPTEAMMGPRLMPAAGGGGLVSGDKSRRGAAWSGPVRPPSHEQGLRLQAPAAAVDRLTRQQSGRHAPYAASAVPAAASTMRKVSTPLSGRSRVNAALASLQGRSWGGVKSAPGVGASRQPAEASAARPSWLLGALPWQHAWQ